MHHLSVYCVEVSHLVGALDRVNLKGLHQGWTQTSVYLQVIHSTSHYTEYQKHSSNCIHNFETQNQKNNNTCFGAYWYSASTQHRNLHPAGWPILFCRPTEEPVLATINKGKTQEIFGKNAGEWTGSVEISKKEIPGKKRSMYDYILTYSRL